MSDVSEERLSDSPYIAALYRMVVTEPITFTSTAETHSELVITRYQGETTVTMRGPETMPTPADAPPDFEVFSIVFNHGTFLPDLPPGYLMNRNDIHLPAAGHSNKFWFQGAAWEIPTFENAETFIQRFIRAGHLVQDFVVEAALQNQPLELPDRTVRRHFLRATGLTQGHLRQIQRARYAHMLLMQGHSILDTVFQAGYFDQPHLTRALRQFIGQTPAQIEISSEPVSVLYNTLPDYAGMLIPD
jgi:AraC-like DNA-binding protein